MMEGTRAKRGGRKGGRKGGKVVKRREQGKGSRRKEGGGEEGRKGGKVDRRRERGKGSRREEGGGEGGRRLHRGGDERGQEGLRRQSEVDLVSGIMRPSQRVAVRSLR